MNDVYRRFEIVPLGPRIQYYRARYFGHILRRDTSFAPRQALLGLFLPGLEEYVAPLGMDAYYCQLYRPHPYRSVSNASILWDNIRYLTRSAKIPHTMLPWLLVQQNDKVFGENSTWYKHGKKLYEGILSLKLLRDTRDYYAGGKQVSSDEDQRKIMKQMAVKSKNNIQNLKMAK